MRVAVSEHSRNFASSDSALVMMTSRTAAKLVRCASLCAILLDVKRCRSSSSAFIATASFFCERCCKCRKHTSKFRPLAKSLWQSAAVSTCVRPPRRTVDQSPRSLGKKAPMCRFDPLATPPSCVRVLPFLLTRISKRVSSSSRVRRIRGGHTANPLRALPNLLLASSRGASYVRRLCVTPIRLPTVDMILFSNIANSSMPPIVLSAQRFAFDTGSSTRRKCTMEKATPRTTSSCDSSARATSPACWSLSRSEERL
mmetsp:Transcript_38983/g.95932  ORF Transcript_38983/g.95932 Transcript_38983/m.95932 type:complete len:256 (-) Transcript_38983:60-827(-)